MIGHHDSMTSQNGLTHPIFLVLRRDHSSNGRKAWQMLVEPMTLGDILNNLLNVYNSGFLTKYLMFYCMSSYLYHTTH